MASGLTYAKWLLTGSLSILCTCFAVCAHENEPDAGEQKKERPGAGWERVTDLDFSYSLADDALCAQLANSKNLTKIKLFDTRVTDSGLSHLSQLSNLESLDLGESHVTGKGLAALLPLRNLKQLSLWNIHLDDGLSSVSKLDGLQQLDLHFCRLAQPEIKFFTGPQSLKTLTMDLYYKEDCSLAFLKNFPGLEKLELWANSNAGLPILKSLSELDLYESDPPKQIYENINQLKTLRRLILPVSDSANAGTFAQLSLPNLQFLALNAATDASLHAVEQSAALLDIELDNAKLSDDGFKPLHSLTKLKSLRLTSARGFSGEGLKVLSESLEQLNLAGCSGNYELPGISDVGLSRALPSLTGLKSVDVSRTGITGECFAALNGMSPRINRLDMVGNRLTKEGLLAIGKLTDLSVLNLGSTLLSSSDLSLLSNLSRLSQLQIPYTNVDGDGLKLLANCSSLRELDLALNDIDDNGIAVVKQLPALETLRLSSTAVVGPGLINLQALKKLRTLDLGSTNLTDSGVIDLPESIEELDLSKTLVTDRCVGSLAKLPRLRSLDLSQTQISDASVSSFSKMKELRQLDLSGTMISDQGLPYFQGASMLTKLTLDGCRVSYEAVAALMKQLPGCHICIIPKPVGSASVRQ